MGLSAKNWAWLEIFLNRIGRRVDFYERKGLFCKIYGADRYLPELTWAETVLGRSIWIGWPRCVWARGAAALLAGAEAPAAASSSEQAGLALQRVFWPTVWSRSMRATRVNHWGHLRGAVGYVAV